MSLVGTRPPTVDEWDKYELHHRARLATKPGLTGMWQVSGRSNITDFEEVVKLDKQYISEWTMGLDIKILYGVKTINVLTGFKFIGEQIGFLEKQGKEDSYIFGMEESYGYLSGSYVRDKDGVNAAFLICEMFTYYASQGIGLFEKLNELYAEYGYCLNTLHSYTFEGSAGFEKMQNIMVSFRKSITEFAGKKVLKCLDYSEGIDGLPKSDVLKFFLEDNCSIVVRPSGTEPKLKSYISVSATTKEEAQVVEGKLARAVEEKM